MPSRRKIYCGDKEDLPAGYNRFGTRHECLKRGYGAALVYSTETQRKNAIRSMMDKGPRKLHREDLRKLALRLGVNVFNEGTETYRRKRALIQDIIDALEAEL